MPSPRSPIGSFIHHGFTLVELITVLVLLGLLTAVAVPRFVDSSAFDERTLQDRLIAGARRAQQLAMAKGPGANVQFVTDAGAREYRITYQEGGPQTLAEDLGGTVSFTSTTVGFNALGENTAGAAVVLNVGGGPRQVCIETTGYAHDCI